MSSGIPNSYLMSLYDLRLRDRETIRDISRTRYLNDILAVQQLKKEILEES